MLEHLFGSKTRLKLLRTFFRDGERSYYVRELTRLLEIQINAVRRELEALLAAGLIMEIEADKINLGEPNALGATMRKYYRLNKESILYPELQALLVKAQALGEQVFIHEVQEKSKSISLFLLTGRFVNEKRSPSDMLIVGNVNEGKLARLIGKYEKEFGFEIRYTAMTEKEFFERRQIMDKFIYSLFEGEHVKVVNTLKV